MHVQRERVVCDALFRHVPLMVVDGVVVIHVVVVLKVVAAADESDFQVGSNLQVKNCKLEKLIVTANKV